MPKQSIWETSSYYSIAHQASEDFSHPALQLLKEYSKKAHSMLEVGCGEGTKLATLLDNNQQGFGIDISETAISKASKQYPHLQVQVGNAEKLPYHDNMFDLVYSAFVLEHTQNPETVLEEMIRVTKENGYVICIAPNYGAPQRCSPCFKGSRGLRLVQGFTNDLFFTTKFSNLRWRKVTPIATETTYEVDWDTTVEPYLKTLLEFVKHHKLNIVDYSSCWEVNEPQENTVNKLFRFLGNHHVYPFTYWGPHLIIVGQKQV